MSEAWLHRPAPSRGGTPLHVNDSLLNTPQAVVEMPWHVTRAFLESAAMSKLTIVSKSTYPGCLARLAELSPTATMTRVTT